MKRIAPILIVCAAFLWAFDGVVLTPWVLDLGVTDVPTFVFMLHATASVFLVWFLVFRRNELKLLKRSDWIAFGLTGLFGGAVGTMAIIGAISTVYHEGLNIAVILLLQKIQPIFAIILALLLLKERPRRHFYVWAVIALAGSYLLTFGFEKVTIGGDGMLVPALLALLAAFSFGASTVFSKRAIAQVSHGVGTAIRFVITTIILVIIITGITLLKSAGMETSYAGFAGFQTVTWPAVRAFVVIALTTGGTAIFLYYWGLKRVHASRSTILEMAFPVSSIVLEFFIHDKILSVGQWIGAIVVLGAIYRISRSHHAVVPSDEHVSGSASVFRSDQSTTAP